MEEEEEKARRLTALCRKLGSLWPQGKITSLDDDISSIYEFKFWSTADKAKVLDQGPWSFANHLLLLKTWEPDTPPACYDFSKCEFWVQIHGLPTEWISDSVITKVANVVGKVSTTKIDARGFTACKIGKAKVELNISDPLIPGSVFSNKGKNVWLDFRYERPPHYCNLSGRLGHYAQNCEEGPKKNEKVENMKDFPFGSWLKAEANENSPFWKKFYGKNIEVLMEEDSISETPSTMGQLVAYEGSPAGSGERKSGQIIERERPW